MRSTQSLKEFQGRTTTRNGWPKQKGTPWIDQQNYQIVHLGTDILKPAPAVRLIEHQVLDYGRVQFEHKKRKLWPPQEAIYLDVNGKSFHHGHTYSDYRVFSVD
jgi:hypothetical protein